MELIACTSVKSLQSSLPKLSINKYFELATSTCSTLFFCIIPYFVPSLLIVPNNYSDIKVNFQSRLSKQKVNQFKSFYATFWFDGA